MVKAYSCLSIKIKNEVATITIEGEHKEHYLSLELLTELNNHILALNNDNSVKVLVIKGKDKAFCSGIETDELCSMGETELKNLSILGQKTLHNLEFSNYITIAAINGLAENAGLEIAMACDFRLGTDKAKLGFSDIKNSVIPSWGTMPRLQRIMKQSLLIEFIYSSRLYHAEDAFRLGLLDKVVHNDLLNDAIDEFTVNINKNKYKTVKNIKSMLKTNWQDANSDSLTRLQADLFSKTFLE